MLHLLRIVVVFESVFIGKNIKNIKSNKLLFVNVFSCKITKT